MEQTQRMTIPDKNDNISNVINFPIKKVTNIFQVEDLDKETIDEHLDEMKNYIITEVLEIIIPLLYNRLAFIGYNITKNTLKEGALVTETIRALLYKHYNIPHSLHALADGMYTIDEKDDLTLTGKLSIIGNTATT